MTETKHKSLEDLFAAIESARNPELQLLEMLIDRTHQTDEELAAALRYCAIPRRFDAEIIGVLRGELEDLSGNHRLLEGLLANQFVMRRKGGGYVYHDSTRDLLLEDWRSTEEKRAKFDEYNQRLVFFYDDQHEQARQLERTFKQVAHVVQRASQPRRRQLVSLIEKQLMTPLVEALYHRTLQSADAGFYYFRDQFHSYEAEGMLTVCSTLLNVTRDYLERVAPDRDEPGQASWLQWLRHYEARLANRLRRPQRAREMLEELLPQIEGDPKLQAWTLSELGNALKDLSLFKEARRVYAEALPLRDTEGVDPYNLAVDYANLADLHWRLEEYEEAASRYREAIEAAEAADNQYLNVSSRLALCAVMQDQGKWSEALTAVLHVMHMVRSRYPREVWSEWQVSWRLMFLLEAQDPRLLDSAFGETKTLMAMLGDAQLLLDLGCRYDELLQAGGQLARASVVLENLQKEVSGYDIPSLKTDLLYREAFLRENQGDQRAAIDAFDRLLAYEAATSWDHAAALSNQATYRSRMGFWDEAWRDLQSAVVKWQEIGVDRLAALVKVEQADLLRRRGRFEEAQALLDETRPLLFAQFSSRQSDHLRVQGHLYRDQGRWQEAQGQYEGHVQISLSLDYLREAAYGYLELARLADQQGRWEEAEQHSAAANELWQRLAAADRYRPTERERRADEADVDGLQHLFLASEERREEKVEQAQASFCTAGELVPENWLYGFNLMYASVELEDWVQAGGAVQTMLERGPRWLRDHPFLEERLVEYRLLEAERQFGDGNYDVTARIYATLQSQVALRESFEILAGAWMELGDRLCSLEWPSQAQASYQPGLECATRAENLALQADLSARTGFLRATWPDSSSLRLRLQEMTDPRLDFEEALRLYRAGEVPSPGTQLGLTCVPLLPSVEIYWGLDTAWFKYAQKSGLESELGAEFMAARQALSTYLDHALQLTDLHGQASTLYPVVTPIALELGDGLVPADTGPEWPLFESYVPEMRERIEGDMGVSVPGLTVRGSDYLEGNEFLILLDEVAMIRGEVQLGYAYCPVSADELAAKGIPTSNPIPEPHPLTGEPGCWLGPEDWEPVRHGGYELWEDPLLFIVSYVERLLRRNLQDFLGLQEVDNLLEEWWLDEDDEDLVGEFLANSQVCYRLARVLRALVAEGVSIQAWQQILETIREVGLPGDDVTEVVQQVRLALKPVLPGNEPDAIRIPLPPEVEAQFEAWIHEQGDKTFFAIPPQHTQEVLEAIRDLVGEGGWRQVLVVRSPRVRPFVRRLVELEFPFLMTIAESELLSLDRPV